MYNIVRLLTLGQVDPSLFDGATPGGAGMILLYIVVGLAIAAGSLFLSVYLTAKAKESKVFAVLTKVHQVAVTVVGFVEARVKPDVVAALKDGVITPEERKIIQDKALQAFKEQLGPAGLAEIKKVLGIGDSGIESFLWGAIEWALQRFSGQSETLALLRPESPARAPASALAAPRP